MLAPQLTGTLGVPEGWGRSVSLIMSQYEASTEGKVEKEVALLCAADAAATSKAAENAARRLTEQPVL